MAVKTGHQCTYRADSNIFLTCEHASDYIPDEYDLLGLTVGDLESSKDLYDPGSRELTECLESQLNASALYAGVSRLVIDCNRRLDAVTKNKNKYHSCALKTELLVDRDGQEQMIKIPKNVCTCDESYGIEERQRYEKYAVPYVNSAYDVVERLRNEHEKTYIVQIHSFFPNYNGEERGVDIGVLYDRAEEPAERIVKNLQDTTALHVAGNAPWNIKESTDGVVFKKIDDMDDVEVVAFDVNNKHLKTRENVEKMAELILGAIRSELITQ